MHDQSSRPSVFLENAVKNFGFVQVTEISKALVIASSNWLYQERIESLDNHDSGGRKLNLNSEFALF